MATHALDLPEIKTAPRGARLKHAAQKIGHVARHPAKSFRGYFGYADGRLWAPERDVEHPHMRRIALAVGKVARMTTDYHSAKPTMAESNANFAARSVARTVDAVTFDHARHKLTNALYRDALTGGTAARPRNGQVPVGEDPRIANLPVSQQSELIYAAVTALEIMGDRRFGINVDLDDKDTRAAVGHIFHDHKVRRHSRESGFIPDAERAPFEQLPPAVQDSEIRQVEIAQSLFGTGHPGLQEALYHSVSDREHPYFAETRAASAARDLQRQLLAGANALTPPDL